MSFKKIAPKPRKRPAKPPVPPKKKRHAAKKKHAR